MQKEHSMLRGLLFVLFVAAFPANTLAGSLNVVGTGDGIDMMTALARDYNAAHHGVEVTVPPSVGSGGGIAAIGSGAEFLARIARPLKPSESEQGIKAVPVARLPSAFLVHRGVGINKLSARQLAGIFDGTVRNWQELGGPDLSIKVVRREDADSTLVVLRESMPHWKDLQLTPKSKLAMTTQEALDSVETVEGAIGFGPFTRELEKRVTVLRVDGVYPGEDKYPSAVLLAVAYKDAPTPEAARFIEYLKSAPASRIMTEFGANPLP
jgi:phosphate transport system substrate-binding protein